MVSSHDDNTSRPVDDVPFQRRVRSFVKREGRMSKRQKTAVDTLFAVYGLTVDRQRPLDYTELFGRDAPTILEIGFGMGDTLALMAQQNPATNFIGIEVHRPGVGSLLATLRDEDIHNVRVFCHDAVEVLEQVIPDHSLDGIHIFFPDPWPKKRHHKRRLIQSTFVKILATKLKPGSRLHIATDWENYAQWIEEVMTQNPAFTRLPDGTVHQRPTTKFETRGRKLGHGVWDLLYVRS
ncbi:MAG: tRNA (guanosine(46)-N7)-methyltransferase TrmB [Gammaproteobacteria bacterium]|jgi:tRNA (guanine-N7-)-methyltransferase